MKKTNISEIYSDSEIMSNGLTLVEYEKIVEILGREPNHTELGIFSVMWSEHCSYKSTRFHLGKLHTKEEWVICGPGENAGIIDIGDNKAVIFKMESHNHPSYIEPYQGSATGVGGIMRDVFTMGARPIAVLDSLRFGEISHAKTKFLLNGVTAGVGGYGNCVGVPNIAGDTIFHKSFNGNILVNAMCIGLAEQDKIFYSAASEIGSTVMYVGAKTGRDGIHGATMASAEFDDESEEKRPTVQVGDPFKEKLLIEACLELMQEDAIIAIQDMGAAGLTSSSLEMASKGHAGIELDMDKVPCRETEMTAYEMMLSESQERMLMVIKPEKKKLTEEIFKKWDLDCVAIGVVTDSKHLVLKHHGEVVADIPVDPLADNAPLYERPYVEPKKASEYAGDLQLDTSSINVLRKLMQTPDLANKAMIYEQYDCGVMNDTISAHNVGAGLVRVHGTKKAIAASTDCAPRYVQNDPFEGAKQAVVATYRNLVSVGAKPLAITNCLNFGNPEKPEIMGQIVRSIEGISLASKELAYPVISGNVSLYNETNGDAIQPVPNIAGVGLIDDYTQSLKNYLQSDGSRLLLVGDTTGHLGATLYLREVCDSEDGLPPRVNLDLEKKTADLILELNEEGLLLSCNDVSHGGVAVTLAKMSLYADLGVALDVEDAKGSLSLNEFLYSEDQARYILEVDTDSIKKISEICAKYTVPVEEIGLVTLAKDFKLEQEIISLTELRELNRIL